MEDEQNIIEISRKMLSSKWRQHVVREVSCGATLMLKIMTLIASNFSEMEDCAFLIFETLHTSKQNLLKHVFDVLKHFRATFGVIQFHSSNIHY